MIAALIFLLVALVLLAWQISQIIAIVAGAPTVYSRDRTIEKAFKLTELKSGQTVVDLGCGNAKTLIIAAKNLRRKASALKSRLFIFF